MIRLLMVDDEQIVRDALLRTIDWVSLGYEARVAQNAMEALEIAAAWKPAILVTDIAMPVVDGIALIQQMRAFCPDLACIVISGYDAFEYARGALREGVTRYILKPFGANELIDAVEEALARIREKHSQQQKAEQGEKLIRMRPTLKKQMIRCLILGDDMQGASPGEIRALLELPEEGYRVVLLAPSPAADGLVERSLDLREIKEALQTICTVDLVIPADQQAIFVLTGADPGIVESELKKPGLMSLLVGISRGGMLKDLPTLLCQAREALLHAAFFGESAVVRYEDIATEALPTFGLDSLARYCDLILSETQPMRMRLLLKNALAIISLNVTDEAQRRVYWMQLFVALVDRNDAAGRAERMALLPTLSSMPREKVENLLIRTATEIASERMMFTSRQIEFLASRMLEAMKEHLHEDDFSLIKLAKDILYANADYLGRVFKKVYHQTFSQALQSLRMECAVRLLETEALTVSEVARRTGYGYNAQYFSQVFRGHFGHTPSEHIRQRL